MDIFHYTSPSGFQKIIESMTLRFTDCEFFNDASEKIYINELFNETLTRFARELKQPYNYYEEVIKGLEYWSPNPYEDNITEIRTFAGDKTNNDIHHQYRYYVFCASKSPDSLSMWNYYIKNNKYHGFNLGVESDELLKTLMQENKIDANNISGGEVIYDKEKQIAIVKDFFINLDKYAATCKGNYCPPEVGAVKLKLELDKYSLLFKHPAFVHEYEYRIFVKMSNQTRQPEFVEKNGFVIPYIALNFSKENIKSINLAPMMKSNTITSGIEKLLIREQFNLNMVKIVRSDIPIRY